MTGTAHDPNAVLPAPADRFTVRSLVPFFLGAFGIS